MSRPQWLVLLLKLAFPQRLLAARATKLPLLGPALHRWLFEGDDLLYLPGDRVLLSLNQPIPAHEDVMLPSQVVAHFIEAASYHWIMDRCLCRDAEKCQDYPIDLGCLFLGEAASGINPKLGRRVTREEALAHVRRCQDAGLVHLIGRNKLDTVWLGVGPGDRLLTICHCCPCCCLWRILPAVRAEIGAGLTRMPGVDVRVSDRCTGCGECARGVCFVDAIQMSEGRAVIEPACRGCGRCVSVCPHGAIELHIEDSDYVQETISRISSRVDVR
jgi:ferredoxin